MTFDGTFRRRNLPHWDIEGKAIFITACLEGSISSVGLSRIRRYRTELDDAPLPDGLNDDESEHEKHKRLFGFVDELLDQQSPVQHLTDSRQADVVQNAFLHFADERYQLFAFVVMPSHHHWLFLPDEQWCLNVAELSRRDGGERRSPREMISHSIQSFTGTTCNRIRGVAGGYWQTETFDHWVRDEEELLGVLNYIENNPVKAGLVTRPEDWRWSSAGIRKRAGLQPGEPIRKFHVT
jgi:putative transposase